MALAVRIRRVLPKLPNAIPWMVEFVDRTEDVDVSIGSTSAVVRLQSTWQHQICDAGLAHVARHYPLAVERLDCQSPDVLGGFNPKICSGLKFWRAITIERGYYRGFFTGQLSLGQAYVVQTFDRLGLFAHAIPAIAVRNALSERRTRLRAIKTTYGRKRLFRTKLSDLLKARLSERKYDVFHTVDLDPFRTLLPLRVLRVLELHGSEQVPLREVERYSVDSVLEIPDELLPTLVYQLDLAVDHAERSAPRSTGYLSDDDHIALGMLAR